MADVLLTHSYHLPYDRKQVRKMQPYPPLGTLYAAGVLREGGVSVAVFDAMLNDPLDGFRESLRTHRPKIVAIYEDDFNFLTKMCLTRMREVAFHMIDAARNAGARVIAHGSDATDHAAEYVQQGSDYVLVGEAENSLLLLVSAINERRDFRGIPGVVWMSQSNSSSVLEKTVPQTPRDFRAFPLPARDLIDVKQYRDSWLSAHGFFSMNMITSRGCPFRCNWCAKPIFGNSFHVRPAGEVAAEMLFLKNVCGAQHIWFADDIFALNGRWTQEFARQVEKLGCAIPFKIQARADLLTSETAHALKRAGCSEVWMGVESGSQKILDAMDKALTVEDVVSARENLKEHGIKACYFLQFGYPGEHWEDIQKTVALVRETRPDDIGVSFSYPLPDTRFYERVRRQLGSKRNWQDSDDLCVTFQGAYTDTLYRAVRDALHAEVDSWKSVSPHSDRHFPQKDLWERVTSLEPISRNPNATELDDPQTVSSWATTSRSSSLIPVSSLVASSGEN